MSETTDFGDQLRTVRPVTRHLVTSVLLDQWPNDAAVVGFGIHSQKHYEALYYPIRARQISPQILDNALGDGERLTAMVRVAPANPHKDVEFNASWDAIFEREQPQQDAYQKMLDEKVKGAPEKPAARENDKGLDR